jgi:hypothetical protein
VRSSCLALRYRPGLTSPIANNGSPNIWSSNRYEKLDTGYLKETMTPIQCCNKINVHKNIFKNEVLQQNSYKIKLCSSRFWCHADSEVSRPQGSSGYRACHWTQGLRVQGLLKAIRTGIIMSFKGELKPVAPCCRILWGVKDPYSKKEIIVGKIHGHFSPSFSCFVLLLGVSPGYCHRALAGESGMIRTQAAKHNRLVMVTVQGTPCVTLPCKQ